MGLILNYYNEPAVKPGGTIGLDWEIPIINNWYGAVSLPELGYFYFPYMSGVIQRRIAILSGLMAARDPPVSIMGTLMK